MLGVMEELKMKEGELYEWKKQVLLIAGSSSHHTKPSQCRCVIHTTPHHPVTGVSHHTTLHQPNTGVSHHTTLHHPNTGVSHHTTPPPSYRCVLTRVGGDKKRSCLRPSKRTGTTTASNCWKSR